MQVRVLLLVLMNESILFMIVNLVVSGVMSVILFTIVVAVFHKFDGYRPELTILGEQKKESQTTNKTNWSKEGF